MVSRKAVFKEHKEYGYSVSKIVDKYFEWVSEDKYMILTRTDFKDFILRDNRNNKLLRVSLAVKNETFAIKMF